MEPETPVVAIQHLSALPCELTHFNVTLNRVSLGTLQNIINTNGPQKNPPLQTPSSHNPSSNKENITPLQTPHSCALTSVGTNVSVDPTILKKQEKNKSYYQRCKQNKIAEANANMEPQTPVGSTQNLLALTCETTLDHAHGSNVLLPLFDQEYNQSKGGNNVGVAPTTQSRREYQKSYYERHKQKNIAIDLYFYDAESEFEHGLNWPNLDREIVTTLSRVLAPNPYVQTFRSLGNLGSLDKYKVELTSSVKDDQIIYNRPTTSEVDGIWVEGNDNIITYKRSIVVYGRSDYPTQIQAYFACYDLLSYPMFFLNGEVGWLSQIPREGVDIRELVDDEDDVAEDEEEIMKNLDEGQTAQDQPDLVTRVFYAKLKYLKHQLFTKHILGVVASHIYVIEFQKRGLPHAYFLLIMKKVNQRNVVGIIQDSFKKQHEKEMTRTHCIDGETMTLRYYTWNTSTRVWKRQKHGKMRGRMVSANPAEGERFYLRVLLQHVKGPAGFDYLYTVDDVLYTTRIFIDGPRGTGKTFLYKALLANVRSRGIIALSTTSSGAAANNMTGGRTSHSRFKIPINLNTNSMCNIKKQSGLAKLLCQAKLIIWDEASMAKR
nr:hypothetical protein [Tanacetum cinerariifolium]